MRLVLKPELRPLEHELAVRIARSALVRVGASGAAVTLAVTIVDVLVR